jgi:hypothetical protein
MSMQRSLWHHDGGTPARPANAAVYWVCRKETHRAAPSRGGRGGLTVHQGRWAYCDGAIDDDRHEWAPTGGVSIDSLVDWAKALDPLRGRTVRR